MSRKLSNLLSLFSQIFSLYLLAISGKIKYKKIKETNATGVKKSLKVSQYGNGLHNFKR